MADPIIDTSGSGVSIDSRALAERVVSYPLYGAIVAIVGYVELIGSGIASAIRSLGAWLSTVVLSTVGIATSSTSVAGASTIGFVESTGVLGLFVAIVLVSLATYLLVRGIATVSGILVRSLT
jgi:hypothetical protein